MVQWRPEGVKSMGFEENICHHVVHGCSRHVMAFYDRAFLVSTTMRQVVCHDVVVVAAPSPWYFRVSPYLKPLTSWLGHPFHPPSPPKTLKQTLIPFPPFLRLFWCFSTIGRKKKNALVQESSNQLLPTYKITFWTFISLLFQTLLDRSL